jgi:protein SERAC1
VAHSLGGVVVKAALIKSASFKNHNRHPRQADIYASTSGVAFFGTPHRGSSKEGFGEILASIAKFCLRQPNKSLLETLKKDSHILEDQRDAWTTISNEMSVICVREELPTAIGMVSNGRAQIQEVLAHHNVIDCA